MRYTNRRLLYLIYFTQYEAVVISVL